MTPNRPRIAIVDDEPRVRTAIGRLLNLADYDVALFASGDEFLGALLSGYPDCAILDIHMPGLSGLDVQAALRAASIDIPVVFITASGDPQVRQRVLATGVDVLTKPFSNNQLLSAVGTAMRKSV